MPNRLLKLAGWVTYATWPSIVCPECREGTVHIDGDLLKIRDPESVENERLTGLYLQGREDLSGTCTGQLTCNNPQCKRGLAISGDWQYNADYDDEPGRELWVDYIRVRYISPPLPIFTPPARTPEKVASAILAASEILWINPNAAANQLRQAIEELLTHKKVKRSVITKKHKRRWLSAHERIEIFRTTNKDVADTLEAVKWIGNSGSHESGLSIADVLEGADLLKHALTELYDRTNHLRRARIRQINTHKRLPRTPKR